MPVNSFDNYPMSWRPQLKKDKGSIHKELTDLLRKDINEGVLLPGTKLPPQRELADFLDINVSTVSRAFKECEQEGLLSSAVGSGTFVAYSAISAEAMLPHSGKSGTIEMGSLSPVNLSTNILKKVLDELVNSTELDHLFEYHFPRKNSWHNEAGARLIGKSGYTPEPESIMFSFGGQNALAAILSGLFRAGDRIGCDPFVFSGLKSLASLYGIRLIPIKTENGEISSSGLMHAVKNENISGLYINPDFQNPTTHIMSEECKDMIARVAVKYDFVVIEDAIFSLLKQTKTSTVQSRAPEQTIHMASISKVIAPGLRTAYISVPEKYRTNVGNALSAINLSISPLSLELSSRLIVSSNLEKLLNESRAYVKRRNSIVDKALAGYEVHGSAECPFRWLVFSEGLDAGLLEDKLHKDHVQIYSMGRFAVESRGGVQAARICAVTPREEKDVITGIKKVKAMIEKM